MVVRILFPLLLSSSALPCLGLLNKIFTHLIQSLYVVNLLYNPVFILLFVKLTITQPI